MPCFFRIVLFMFDWFLRPFCRIFYKAGIYYCIQFAFFINFSFVWYICSLVRFGSKWKKQTTWRWTLPLFLNSWSFKHEWLNFQFFIDYVVGYWSSFQLKDLSTNVPSNIGPLTTVSLIAVPFNTFKPPANSASDLQYVNHWKFH